MARIYIETYGCALNKSDELLMKHSLLARGHSIVSSIDDADVVVINTCVVRQDTEYKMIHRIKELRDYCRTMNKRLVVAGCMARTHPYTVSKLAPEASLVSPQNASRIHQVVESLSRTIMITGRRERDKIGLIPGEKVVQIPIQEGCLSNCSFCIAKYARRELVSHSIEAVTRAVSDAVDSGAVEVELTGMDLGAYGVDIYRRRALPRLLRELVDRVKGNYMIRIGMINPEHLHEIADELVEVITSSSNIYRFLHIPLQSGSDKVLRLMNRKYTVDEYRSIVKEIKSKIPDVSIATDIIIGHPGEDEEDFEETLRVIRELEFERVHLAGYSQRPLTMSASMPQVNTRTKKERMIIALRTIEEVGLKVRQKYLHTVVTCIITEKTNTWIGRLGNYIPVVLKSYSTDIDYGKWLRVYIDEITFYDIRGVVIQ